MAETNEDSNVAETTYDMLSRPDLWTFDFDLSDPEPVAGQTVAGL